MSDAAIQLQEVTRTFGPNRAVDGLSLAVPKGTIYGFLGPNGAGKTTTIRMIMGHLHPTAGQVTALGVDPWHADEDAKQRVAYVSENMALPGWMKPEAAIRLCAPLYPKWDHKLAESLLDAFSLRGKGRFSALSKGQKRATCILLALCQNADLLVIDEPASGLDTIARRDFLDRVLDVACEEGRTVFVSSHILSDLERVVDRIGIICNGSLALEGELDALKGQARKLQFADHIESDALASSFTVLKYKAGAGETEAVVLGFEEGRFRTFCAEHGCGEGARDYGLNLEDLFVEVARSNGNHKEGQ